MHLSVTTQQQFISSRPRYIWTCLIWGSGAVVHDQANREKKSYVISYTIQVL